MFARGVSLSDSFISSCAGGTLGVISQTRRRLTANTDPLSFKGRVHQNHSGYFLGIGRGKIPYHWPTVGVTDKYKWTWFTKLGKSVSQFDIQRLHQDPVEGKIPQAVFHDNRGALFFSAVHVQTVSTQSTNLPSGLGSEEVAVAAKIELALRMIASIFARREISDIQSTLQQIFDRDSAKTPEAASPNRRSDPTPILSGQH